MRLREPVTSPLGRSATTAARSTPVRAGTAQPYAVQGHDAVRRAFEERLLGRLLPRLLDAAGGGAVLDLGCGDGLAARLAGDRLTRYLGVDLAPSMETHPWLAHDLREGLGEVGRRPFDLYLGTFGIASHLSPGQLDAVLRDVARHARPGAIVALEALGLHSLEWPRLWGRRIGSARTIPYCMGADVAVHPWEPGELLARFEAAGIEPLRVLDRTLQAGPKAGGGRYWPGLPPVRAALCGLLHGAPLPGGLVEPAPLPGALVDPLPPLPAGLPALVHHTLATHRRALVERTRLRGRALARAIWALDPPTAGGYGHGLLMVGRVR